MLRHVAAILLGAVSLFVPSCGFHGTTAQETLGRDLLGNAREWARTLPAEAAPGAKLFAQAGCLNCHTYRVVGDRN
jgi:hypothetical protein